MAVYTLLNDVNFRGVPLRAGKRVDSVQYDVALLVAAGALLQVRVSAEQDAAIAAQLEAAGAQDAAAREIASLNPWKRLYTEQVDHTTSGAGDEVGLEVALPGSAGYRVDVLVESMEDGGTDGASVAFSARFAHHAGAAAEQGDRAASPTITSSAGDDAMPAGWSTPSIDVVAVTGGTAKLVVTVNGKAATLVHHTIVAQVVVRPEAA